MIGHRADELTCARPLGEGIRLPPCGTEPWREATGVETAGESSTGDAAEGAAGIEPNREGRGPFIKALADGGGKWLIRVIRAGLSGNGVFYPDAVLREAVPLFAGARVFVKGDDEHLIGKSRFKRDNPGKPLITKLRTSSPTDC